VTRDADATADAITRCGRCGRAELQRDRNRLRCADAACGWTYFTNVAAAVAVLLVRDGRVLMVRRGRAPAAGKLDLPGGFVDPGETAEAAAIRELREELNLDLSATPLRYLCSVPNVYPYADVTYHSLDTYFVADLPAMPSTHDAAELTGHAMADPHTVDPEDLAFDATRAALAALVVGGW
jgi:ADP-ribose pyrophosphatase YjhB (NUDIX family)